MLRERIIGGYDLDPTGTLDEMVISLNLYCDFKDFDQNTKGLTGRCCTWDPFGWRYILQDEETLVVRHSDEYNFMD